MADYKFKSRKTNIILKVEKENEQGKIESKDLSFSCALKPFTLRQKVAGLKDMFESQKEKSKIDIFDEIVKKEKEIFELMAAGQWDEFYDFLEEDTIYISELIALMIEKVAAKYIEDKKAEILPEVPDGEEV